jgi:hypothetical protein
MRTLRGIDGPASSKPGTRYIGITGRKTSGGDVLLRICISTRTLLLQLFAIDVSSFTTSCK